jgi:cytochrome c peroxidase
MRAWLIIGPLAAMMALAFYPAHLPNPATTPEETIARMLSAQVVSFDSLVEERFVAAVRDNAGQATLHELFLKARLAYKRWEWAAQYWNPALARKLDGEPVPEADPVVMADPATTDNPGRFTVVAPEGLQVIETFLFPHYDTTRKKELLDRLQRIHGICLQYERYFDNIGLLPGQIFDAARLEVFRVETLGITGFDAPLTLHCMEESAGALRGVSVAMRLYAGSDGLLTAFDSADGYLDRHPDFNAFDRALFIARYGNPLSMGITGLAGRLKVPVIRYNRLLQQDAATLFDRDAFNADAYLPEDGRPTTAALVALGKRLFSDPMLSGPGIRSCASCHRPDLAFTDGLPRNTVLGGHVLLPRNTPTLLNAALQPAQFYDLRAATLEEQIRDVLHNPMEMQASLAEAFPRLVRDSVYKNLLVDTAQIVQALAAYVRSLVRLDSRFDSYMRGDSTALKAEEVRGFNLFMGKGRCGTCHYMPLFNGSFPPVYSRTEAEVIGVPGSPGSGVVDADEGQFGVLPASFLRHAFKTPTVRNAGRTAPYMHNGVFSTLEQVVDFYDHGGGVGEGERLDNQTLPTDSLHLSGEEKKALAAFLRSLDSR